MPGEEQQPPATPTPFADVALIEALIDTAQCLVCVLDPEGRIVRFNALCERATGYSEQEVLGRDIRDLFIPPEDREAFGELLEEVWATMLPSPKAGEWVLRDGSRMPVAWSNKPLTDANGDPSFLVTAGIDLSGRDLLHAQLSEQLALAVRLAEEQASLRRVATLVARGADPLDVFAAVSEETAGVMHADGAGVLRFDPNETATVVGRFAKPELQNFVVGDVLQLDLDSAITRVFRTGRATRIDAYDELDSELGAMLRQLGYTSSVAAPIRLHDRVWGTLVVVTRAGVPLPAGSEARLEEFAELVSVALAGAEAHEQLLESRERIVRAGDDERRRLERNLHDGAQQRLVALAIALRLTRGKLERGEDAGDLVEQACGEVELAIEDLRALAQGLHPPLLTQGGVGPALRAVAGRLPLDVDVDVPATRFHPDLEAALYFVSAEALTNAVKHAEANAASVRIEAADGHVTLRVSDDGRGGADEDGGSGLRGLRDRVEALRGTFAVESGAGAGTVVHARLPLLDAG